MYYYQGFFILLMDHRKGRFSIMLKDTKIFGMVSKKHNTPVYSLIISGVLVNILMLANYQKSTVSAFAFITLSDLL